MPPHRLGDLLADGVERIERRHRLLENHRDQRAAQLRHLALALGADVTLANDHLAFDHRALPWQQPQERAHHHRLARAGLPDHAQHLAALEIERDAVHGAHGGLAADELHVEIPHLQERAGRQGGVSLIRRCNRVHRNLLTPPRRLRARDYGRSLRAPCGKRRNACSRVASGGHRDAACRFCRHPRRKCSGYGTGIPTAD